MALSRLLKGERECSVPWNTETVATDHCPNNSTTRKEKGGGERGGGRRSVRAQDLYKCFCQDAEG